MRNTHNSHKYLQRFLVGLILVSAGLFLLSMGRGHAAVGINKQINFQGKVVNTDGTNVTNGNYSFTFRIYTSTTGDTASPCANTCMWEETKTLTVTNGIFQTNLGDTTALPGSVNFNTDSLYIGINFNADGEMTPRVRLTATPYAFNADNLDGLDSSAFVQLSPAAPQSGNISLTTSNSVTAGTVNANTLDAATSGALTVGSGNATSISVTKSTTWSTGATVTIQGNATINTASTTAFLVKNGTSNIFDVDTSNKRVGIGTNAPNTMLDVRGDGTAGVQVGVSSQSSTQFAGINIGRTITDATVGVAGSAGNYSDLSASGDIVLRALAGNMFLTAQNNTGSITFSTGATGSEKARLVLSNAGNLSFGSGAGNFDQSASTGTFATGSGSVSLNGNATVTGTKTFTVSGGLATLSAGLTESGGAASINASSNFATSINTGTSTGTVTIGNSLAGAITLQSGAAISMTGAAASTWDIGNNTLSLQTTGNGAITTGSGLWTQGGNITFSSTAARTITGPSTGGLTLTVASGPLTLSTTSSGTLAVTSAAALNLTGAAASTWSVGAGNTLTVTSQDFNVSSAGAVTAASNINSTGGALQTNSTTRVDNSGNIVNAGNWTATTGSTFNTTGANGFIFKPGTDNSTAFQVQRSNGAPLFVADTTTNNLLTNPGFETGITNWSARGTSTLSQNSTKANTYNGLYSLKAVVTASSSGASTNSFTTTIASGTQYTLSMYVESTSALSALRIGYTTSGGDTACATTIATLTTGFQRIACTFTPSANVTAIWVDNGTAGGSTTIYIDSVQLQTGAVATAYSIGLLYLRSVIANPISIQANSDSTSALQILNAAGSATVFTVDTINQRIGVGTATPTQAIDVVGTVNASTGYSYAGTAGQTFSCGSNTYINTAVVQGGIITGHSACTSPGLSDQRLKTNIVSLDGTALDSIRGVNPVTFNFDCSNSYFASTDTYCDPRLQTGVIAQQLMQIFPDLVYTDEWGYYHVDYQGLSVETLKATSEIAQHIDSAGNANFTQVSTGELLLGQGSASDPAPLSGAMYYNVATGSFRCSEGGGWVNCIGGLLGSNTAVSNAIAGTSTQTAFSWPDGYVPSIPANFCTAGRTLHLVANGLYSDVASGGVPTLTFSVGIGTSAATATTIGNVSGAIPVYNGNGSNKGWMIDYHLICNADPGNAAPVEGDGVLTIDNGSGNAGSTVINLTSTQATNINTASAQNVYVFAQWGTADAGNTITARQLILNAN